MIRKEIIIPVAIILLTVIFASVSAFVFFSKGKSKFWVSQKMKIGAVLLTLCVITVQPSCKQQVTCYDVARTNNFVVETDSAGKINLDISENNKITGKIYLRDVSNYSFKIANTGSIVKNLFKGAVMPSDGVFNSTQENFFVEIDKSIKPGEYSISFFPVSIELQGEYGNWDSFILNIK